MKNCSLKSNPFSVRNLPDSICPKPQPDELIELDMIEVFPKEVKWSGEQRMSEEVRFSEQSKTSQKSMGINLLRRSSNLTNENLKFVSIISSDNSQKLFKHKCTHIEDEYLTCECNKCPKEVCRQPQCTKTCASFKFQNKPKLYETVRDSTSSANTVSGISESLGGSNGYCEMPNANPQVKLSKELVCKCEAGKCRNHKCPCKKNGQFCDFNVCDCRECRNLLLFSKIQGNFRENEMQQQSQNQSISQFPTIMQEENSAKFEEMNFFLHIKSSSMEFQN